MNKKHRAERLNSAESEDNMEKFNLIGVRVYQNKNLIRTRYFEVGKLKEAIEYARDMGSANFTYDFICCDKYGNYICNL